MAARTRPLEVAPAAGTGAEGEAVAEDDPLNGDDGEADVVHHQRIHDEIGAHETAVEEGQTGGHDHDQRRGGKQPCSVTAVDVGDGDGDVRGRELRARVGEERGEESREEEETHRRGAGAGARVNCRTAAAASANFCVRQVGRLNARRT